VLKKQFFGIKKNRNMTTMTDTKDIVAIATTSAKTLAAAVTAAGLAETLQGDGPFTVFAPTDAAFAAIQTEVDKLLMPENKDKLTSILTYHVVSGEMTAADLKDGQELTTVEGGKLKVSIKDGKVMVGNAHVTAADIGASNGVIHVTDKVLLQMKINTIAKIKPCAGGALFFTISFHT